MVALNRCAAVAAVAAASLVTSLALAADEPPKPTSCAGVAFTDPAGDATYTPTTLQGQTVPSARKANDNLDVREGFFIYVPNGSGANVLTANIRFANLTQTLDAGSTNIVWYMKFRIGEVLNYAAATSDGKAVKYTYGTQAGSSLTEIGTTTGKLFEGKDGIVQIVLPVAALKIEGKTLAKPFGVGAYAQGTAAPLPSASLSSTADSGPDNTTTGGKDFLVTPCAEGDTPTPLEPVPTATPTPTATPAPGTTPTPTPTPSPGGGGSGQPPATQPPAAPPPAVVAGPVRLNLSVVAGKQSARKIARKRRLSVGLVSTGRVSTVTAKLLRGKKVVAKAKLAQVNGKARLTFKLRKPKRGKLKFKAGAYTLQVTGRNADGRVATGMVQFAVKK